MRNKPSVQLEGLRRVHPAMGVSPVGSMYGYFEWERRGLLRIVSSGEAHEGMPWEHVSISLANRCPTWDEMCAVKDLFWLPIETALQFHPRKSAYVNFHPYCLHLWKNVEHEVELPPEWTIGPKE